MVDFYNHRVDVFNYSCLKIEDFKLLTETNENNRVPENERVIETIFNYFERENLHPNIVKIHLGNFLIKICAPIKEMGGSGSH